MSFWRRLGFIGLLAMLVLTQGCGSLSVSPSAPPTATASAPPSVRPAPTPCLRGEYRALPLNGEPVSSEGLDVIRTIIGDRLMAYGFAQPDVQTQGTDRIVVQLPASANQGEVRALIGATGRIDFVEVPPARASEVVVGQPIPADLRVIFSGDQVASASSGFTSTGQRAVDLTFKDEGARIFDEYAAAHFGEEFAIVLDNVVVSAPVINATRFGGKAQISGSFSTQADVNQLVTVLRYGALPNALEEVSFELCSAQ